MVNILIVEDLLHTQMSLRDFLEDEGFKVQVASGTGSGLTYAKSGEYQIIICDIVFGDKKRDGFDLIYQVRNLERKGKIPKVGVIFITGYADEQKEKKSQELGAIDFIRKPFDNERLLGCIKEYCQKNRIPLKDIPVPGTADLEKLFYYEVKKNVDLISDPDKKYVKVKEFDKEITLDEIAYILLTHKKGWDIFARYIIKAGLEILERASFTR